MFAGKLLKDTIPPLKLGDTCQRAIMWMDEFHVSHLPVINGKSFAGLIKQSDLIDTGFKNTPEPHLCL
jgi:predicted transcriptional regulator